MSNNIGSSRRTFLKGGALLAAPIAAASVTAVTFADEGLKARVTQLEDEAEIRRLHQAWLRRVNSGERDVLFDDAVRQVTADHAGAPDQIAVAADGGSAVGHFDHAVALQTALGRDCTLAQMAHVQGHGTVRRTERRQLIVRYLKSDGAWRMDRLEWRTL
ncbi:MAG TPA: hypothetical protein VK696_01165 [Steroidobacteraceae bacterium]|jgi:hypothetical protein|nr:hypothetical protein [Steroidobacteraceae bacterium]